MYMYKMYFIKSTSDRHYIILKLYNFICLKKKKNE